MSWKKTLIILLATLMLLATITLVKADDNNDVISQVTSDPQPNVVLAVKRQSGNCPNQVGMWVISFGYVRTAAQSQKIVIADTLAFVGAAELISEQRTLAEYKAPLQKAYIDCVGTAIYPVKSEPTSLEAHYRFEFKDEIVKFTTQLDEAEGIGFGFGEIKIFGLRPYFTINVFD